MAIRHFSLARLVRGVLEFWLSLVRGLVAYNPGRSPLWTGLATVIAAL